MKSRIIISGLSFLVSSAVFAVPLAVTDGKATFIAKAVPGFLSIDSSAASVEGELSKDGKKITGELRCKMDGFNISIDFRNEEMRNKYLKVVDFPLSVLKLESFEVDDNGLASDKPFKGTLKIRDQALPVEGTASVEKDGAVQKVMAKMTVNTKTFGLGVPSHSKVTLKEDVAVTVEFNMAEKALAAVPVAPATAVAAPAVGANSAPAAKDAGKAASYAPAKDSGKEAPKDSGKK